MVIRIFFEKAFLIHLFLWKLQSVTETSLSITLNAATLNEGLFSVFVKNVHEL